MRILVLSDNHGNKAIVNQIVHRERVDRTIHCGDFCTTADDLPGGEELTLVRGNCDVAPVPDEAAWEGGGLRFFVTHGHRYGVHTGLTKLMYRAKEAEANVVCFGHSHSPYCAIDSGILFINPGSVVQPRGYRLPTYAILEVVDQGTVKVHFYTPAGEPVPKLGGSFILS